MSWCLWDVITRSNVSRMFCQWEMIVHICTESEQLKTKWYPGKFWYEKNDCPRRTFWSHLTGTVCRIAGDSITQDVQVNLQCVLFFNCTQEICTARCLGRGAAGSGRWWVPRQTWYEQNDVQVWWQRGEPEETICDLRAGNNAHHQTLWGAESSTQAWRRQVSCDRALLYNFKCYLTFFRTTDEVYAEVEKILKPLQ